MGETPFGAFGQETMTLLLGHDKGIPMAQFYAEAQGNRGAEHRLGSKASGARTTCNGWTCGVRVIAYHDEAEGDCFKIYRTGGSNGYGGVQFLGTVREGKPTVDQRKAVGVLEAQSLRARKSGSLGLANALSEAAEVLSALWGVGREGRTCTGCGDALEDTDELAAGLCVVCQKDRDDEEQYQRAIASDPERQF